MPFWLAIIPFAIAFAMLAGINGFSSIETMLMSLIVFAGSAQLAIVDLAGHSASYLAILLTVLLLNLRHLLYALTLDLKLRKPREVPSPVLAAGLTDESVGLTIAQMQHKPTSDWFVMGTVAAMYSSFAFGTAVGIVLGGRIPDPERLHLDVVFPLTFLALLLPLVRSRRSLVIAVTGGILSVALKPVIGSSNAVLIAILAGGAVGMLLPRRVDTRQIAPSENVPS